jgi:hypothetical protein
MDKALRCLCSLLRLEDTNQCGEASSPHLVINVVIDESRCGDENKKPRQ